MKEKLKIRPGVAGFALTVDHVLRRIASHRHDELEVNLVVAGRATYLLGPHRVPLLAGSMLWLFPGQEHVLIDWSRDFLMWVIVFRPELVARCAGAGDRRVLRASDPGEIHVRQLDARRWEPLLPIYQSAASEEHDPEFVNAALGYALVASWRAYRFSSEEPIRSDVHPAVARAARLIVRADRRLSLAEIAHAAGLSPARLSRLFHHQTGLDLTTFQQNKTLERFLRLYRSGARHTLIEAALEAGFGSYAQFHRVFRRVMGMSPASYRKRAATTPEGARGNQRSVSTSSSPR